MRLMGQCPVWNFEIFEPVTETQAKRFKALSSTQDNFRLIKSYKGLAGIVDNISRFMGYLDKGTNNGALYNGVTLTPMKLFKDNFQILSTDYENYAIVYTCTYKTTMYNRDDITILVRDLADMPELLETIQQEFDKIFGGQEQLDEEPEMDVFKKTGSEETQEGEGEGEEFLKIEEGTGEMRNIASPKGLRNIKTNTTPLKWDDHLEELNHEECAHYPDLSLTQVQRDKI